MIDRDTVSLHERVARIVREVAALADDAVRIRDQHRAQIDAMGTALDVARYHEAQARAWAVAAMERCAWLEIACAAAVQRCDEAELDEEITSRTLANLNDPRLDDMRRMTALCEEAQNALRDMTNARDGWKTRALLAEESMAKARVAEKIDAT